MGELVGIDRLVRCLMSWSMLCATTFELDFFSLKHNMITMIALSSDKHFVPLEQYM